MVHQWLSASSHLPRPRRDSCEDTTATRWVVYPLVFLWRHYLELRLKELIVSSGALVGARVNGKNLTHNLGALWAKLRPLLAPAVGASDDDLGEINEIVKEFERVDPVAEAFRYAKNTKGQRPAPRLQRINLYHFSRRMERLSILLDGCSDAVSESLKHLPDDW